MRNLAVKKAISMPEDVWIYGKEKSTKLFGGVFSNYIVYLISRDREGIVENVKVEEKKDSGLENIIDGILDGEWK